MKPKGKLIPHKDSIEYRRSHGESHRYDVYANWDFLWGCGFLRTPIGEWCFRYYRTDRTVYFYLLFVTLRWSKCFRYVERMEWISRQRQKKMDDIHNQIVDNITLSKR